MTALDLRPEYWTWVRVGSEKWGLDLDLVSVMWKTYWAQLLKENVELPYHLMVSIKRSERLASWLAIFLWRLGITLKGLKLDLDFLQKTSISKNMSSFSFILAFLRIRHANIHTGCSFYTLQERLNDDTRERRKISSSLAQHRAQCWSCRKNKCHSFSKLEGSRGIRVTH